MSRSGKKLLFCAFIAHLAFVVAEQEGSGTAAAVDSPSPVSSNTATENEAAEKHREAFLGKDEAPEFNKLSPEQAKQRLAELLHKIDTNGDQSVSLAELVNWMRHVGLKDRIVAAEKRLKTLKTASDSDKPGAALTFQEYELALQREMLRDSEHQGLVNATASVNNSLAALMSRSRARWALADANGDGRLTAAELADFLRPEESPRMHTVVIQEALDTADANRDGRIDMGEYLRDIYPDYDKDRREGKAMPDWVVKEEAHFRLHLDLDKDGTLNDNEIYKLAVPDSADHAQTEAQFLFSEADSNGDKFLSMDEILNKWKAFVGHAATNFGAFDHQEL